MSLISGLSSLLLITVPLCLVTDLGSPFPVPGHWLLVPIPWCLVPNQLPLVIQSLVSDHRFLYTHSWSPVSDSWSKVPDIWSSDLIPFPLSMVLVLGP